MSETPSPNDGPTPSPGDGPSPERRSVYIGSSHRDRHRRLRAVPDAHPAIAERI